MSRRFRVGIWLAWLLLAIVVTAPYFRWEVDYFRSPGPVFRTVLLCSLPLLAATCVGWIWFRRSRLWRYEIPVLAAFVVLGLLIYQPLATLIVTLFYLACLVSGCRFARFIDVPLNGLVETLTLGFGFGCALLIPLLFVLGLLHFYYAPVFAVILAGPCLIFRREVINGFAALRRALTSTAEFRHPLAGVVFVFAILGTAAAMAVVLAPSIAFDPLAMHLASARDYAQAHALEVIPSLDYSYFPQGGEVLMTLAWSLGGQPAAQMISPLFSILSLLLLFAIARSCGLDKTAAFVAVATAALLPFAHWSFSNSKNDSAMVFFQAAALLAFIRWLETRHGAWIFAGALFLGSTFAVKHVALYGAIPLICFFVYAAKRLRVVLIFCAIFVASSVYWHVRTGLLTGNPIYPATIHRGLQVGGKGPPENKFVRVCLVAWRAQFKGGRTFESPLPNPVGIVFLVFLPLVILVPSVKLPARRACLIFCATYLPYWMVTAGIVRYAILPISLLVVLLMGKAKTFYDELDVPLARASVAVALAGTLLFACLGFAIIEVNGPMLMLFTRRIDSEQYLDLALRTHPSLAWLSASHVGSNIFGVDNCSRVYAPDPANFYCSFGDWERVTPSASRCQCEYVVMPSGRKPRRTADALHDDPFFTIWRIKQP